MRFFSLFKTALFLTSVIAVFGTSVTIFGQCPPFSFSASPGPNHRTITLTIGGQINGTATVQIMDANGQWQHLFSTLVTGSFPMGGYGHNQTVRYRAQNGGSCTGYSESSATTFDVGQPWLRVWPGPGNSVYIQSGAVSPDMNSAVFMSTTGVEPFTFHSSWQTLPPNVAAPQIVPITTNVTYYFYARIDLGGGQIRRTPTYMVRLSPDQDFGSCSDPWKIRIVPEAPKMVGKPVNVVNGNMYLAHTDYILSGTDTENKIGIERSYNSLLQNIGLFGLGWTTEYDQYLTFIDSKNVRLQLPDGRGIYFARASTSDPFTGITPGFPGILVVNGDGTLTLQIADGRTTGFSATGALVWQRDRNGNQTTVNYNSSGVITGVTDSFGRSMAITIGSNGLVSEISDAYGIIAAYEYFPSSSLLKTVTFPDGSKYQFEYDTTSSPGRTLLKTVKDALNNVLETHLYDSQGRATTSEEATVGGQVQNKYSLDYSNPNFTTVTDGLGRVTKYHFDRTNSRNVVKKIEGLCNCGGSGSETTEYFYDTNLNLTKQTDGLGRDTIYIYDADQNLSTLTDVLGTQKWTYNSFGQVLTYKDRVDSQNSDPNVNTQINTYDANGNLLTSKDALNNVTTFTYKANGQLESAKDARNNTTTLTYDSFGRLTQIKDAANKTTNYGYDARARLTSITNTLSETTSLEYDLHNRVKKVVFPDSNFIENTYDLAGRRTAMRDARGNVTSYSYDSAYRLTAVTDPLSHSVNYGYDLMSNVISSTDALGNLTNLEYDTFNRPKKLVYPAAVSGGARLEESFTYDTVGNLKTRVDTAGRTTGFDYDTSNRLIKITDALNKQTNFEYNLRSQLTKVNDALNQEYLFTYDALGRVLSQTRAGTTMSFEYDAVGNRILRTDHMGRRTAYEYDALDRLTEIEYLPTLGVGIQPPPAGMPNATATYAYDDLSRLVSATNSSGTVAFAYDNRGRLKTETDVFGNVIEFGYDANGNRTQLKLNSNVHTTYAYDAANRLTTLTDDASQSFTYAYDIADRLISKALPNGVTTTYEYDGMSRLTRLRDTGPGGVLFDRQYSYNAANQISQIAELTGTKVFGYDNIDRLTSVADAVNGNESYAFDGVGNRTASHLSNTYTHQPFNRLTATETGSYSQDANGNTVSKVEGSKRWTYTWDYENRLTQAWDRKTRVRYQYDALGRRVERNLGFGRERTRFTYDGEDVLLDNANGTQTKYLNGPGIDNKLSVRAGSAVSYFLADHLGSTNGLADATGSLTAQTGYDAFGNATNAAFPTRYQFTGREFDSFTGLQFSRARFYDPRLGRFISEDPIGFAGGDINLYGYVRNRPLTFTDSLGLDPEWDQQVWRAEQDLIELLAPAIEFGMGFGDMTLFDLSRRMRQWQGIDEPTLDCSTAYQAGGWTAIAVQVAAGGVGGLRAAGAKTTGYEFSHWVPKRYGGPRSLLNGNYVPTQQHALSDPFRYRFMPRSWKSRNPMPPAIVQQWHRIPKVFKGTGVGVGSSVVSSSLASSACGCR